MNTQTLVTRQRADDFTGWRYGGNRATRAAELSANGRVMLSVCNATQECSTERSDRHNRSDLSARPMLAGVCLAHQILPGT